MRKDAVKVYRALGYEGVLPVSKKKTTRAAPAALAKAPTKATRKREEVAELPPLDLEELDLLERQLANEPQETLARAQEAFDRTITLADLHAAIADGRAALTSPTRFVSTRKSAVEYRRAVTPLPGDFTFPGMDLDEIGIQPGDTQFEDSDVLGWLLFSGFGWIKDKLGIMEKAEFQWHDSAESGFVYPLDHPGADGKTSFALLSDFGTGTFTARYIAKQLQAGGFPYVVHLGDVYYGGRHSEFEKHIEAPFAPLFESGCRVLLMNANHEMYSGGKPYFAYLERQKEKYANQLQEGSYFCLRSDAFQIVGIDTAYHRVGRHCEPKLNDWLGTILRDGRDEGRINIFLSQNPPYRYGSIERERLVTEDLRPFTEEGLIDLWFWGDTHYCALYDWTRLSPFIGSCIGHGGKPYPRMKVGAPTAAPVRFLEAAARFPRKTKLRPDQGNNGYCVMTLVGSDEIELRYIDWMGNVRCTARLHRTDGLPRLKIGAGLIERPIP